MSKITFDELFEKQIENQVKLLQSGQYAGFVSHDINKLPDDDPKLMSYHIQQLISEIGEVLEADKRWKNFRANKFERNEKLQELADCFIVLFNICMFSGFSSEEIANAIYDKMCVVKDRINELS